MIGMADHPQPGYHYLTSAEVARHLGVSPRTVGKWLERGLITPTWRTLGGHARFLAEDVDRQAAEIHRKRGD
jgi:excisionase family DNA binding protein